MIGQSFAAGFNAGANAIDNTSALKREQLAIQKRKQFASNIQEQIDSVLDLTEVAVQRHLSVAGGKLEDTQGLRDIARNRALSIAKLAEEQGLGTFTPKIEQKFLSIEKLPSFDDQLNVKTETKSAEEISKAQATNQGKTFLKKSGEFVSVDTTDTKTISELRSQGAIEAPVSLAATSANDLALGKKAEGIVDEKIIKTDDALARIDAIERDFDDSFLELGTRFKFSAQAALEKLGANIPKKDKEALTRYSRFKRISVQNLNQGIKDTTGATMSESEAKRIIKALPDPGTGIFDGDSPTVFKAKIESVKQELLAGKKRAVFLKQRGIELNESVARDFPLSSFVSQEGSSFENLESDDLRSIVGFE